MGEAGETYRFGCAVPISHVEQLSGAEQLNGPTVTLHG